MSTYTVVGNTKISSSASVIYRTLTIPATTNQTYTLTLTKGSLGTLPSYTNTSTSIGQTLSLPYNTLIDFELLADEGYTTDKFEIVDTDTNEVIDTWYKFTINQSDNQTITVTCGGTDYTSTFLAHKSDTWAASVSPASGYNAGTLSATSGTITGDTSVSVGEATVAITYPRVGGTIFYVADSDNGATYTFYDESGNVMSDVGVGSTPYYYEVNGTPTSDKYYVYYPTLDTTTYCWTYSTDGTSDNVVYETTGATGTAIGTGKSNTSTVMNKNSLYVTGFIYTSYHAIWYYINNIRTANTNGCSDWFIPSKEEMEALRTSIVAPDLSRYPLWSSSESSSEYSSRDAWFWYSNGGYWSTIHKNIGCMVVSVRAF